MGRSENCNLEDISAAIKMGGLQRKKAVLITKILEEIYRKRGEFDLIFSHQLCDEDAENYLVLPQVSAIKRRNVYCSARFIVRYFQLTRTPIDWRTKLA